MITLDLGPGDCRNLAEMMDLFFFENLKLLLEMDELDNIDYLRSMLHTLDVLKEAGKTEEIR